MFLWEIGTYRKYQIGVKTIVIFRIF